MVIFQGKSRYDNLIARRLIPSSVPKILEHITLDFGTFCMTLSKLCLYNSIKTSLYNSIKTSFLDNVASIITSKVFKRADTLGVLYPCLYSIHLLYFSSFHHTGSSAMNAVVYFGSRFTTSFERAGTQGN